MQKCLKQTLTLLFAFWLVACNAVSDSPLTRNRILVWHGWTGPEAAALQTLIDDFTTLNPQTRIIVDSFSIDTTNDLADVEAYAQDIENLPDPQQLLFGRFTERAALGLGPDLFIGPSGWVRELADVGLIQDLTHRIDDPSIYLSTAVETLRYHPPDQPETGLYGLPLTLDTWALYYNKTMVTTPAETLNTLLLQARDGQKVALNSSFGPAFWGVTAFGGQLFDADGRVLLDRGGFANWLNWLKTAQAEANIILEDDQPTLEALFKQGNVAYVVGEIDSLPDFQAALGEDEVGVVPLPRGPNQPAGPLLRTEAAMLNAYSSAGQSDLAFQLAQFLTNTAQQTALMRHSNKIPANNRVRVDPQVYPITAAFLSQARSAVPFSNLPQMDTLLNIGNEAYLQALTGAVSPNEAAQLLTKRVNEFYGFAPLDVETTEAACDLSGQVTVWHRWPDSLQGTTLQNIANEFTERCPAATITLRGFERESLRQQYPLAVGQPWAPDLVIAPSHWLPIWAKDGLISNLNGIIQPERLQQYNATAISAMQFEEGLYGLPVWLDLMALYYRADKVTDPPRVVDDLLTQTGPDNRAVLPLNTNQSTWGAFSFGFLTYDDAFNLQLDPEGTVAWLEWLQAAEAHPGIILSFDPVERQEIFKTGQASYYAGNASELTELQQALGISVLRVAPFPAGPAGEARPPLLAEGIMVNPDSLADPSGQHADLVLEFGRYITSQEVQKQLMAQANVVPSHINVDTTGYPAIAGFLEQAETAVVLWIAPIQADPSVHEAANRIIETMIEQAVFGDETATEAAADGLAALKALQETAE